jgi:hypothetical protein
LPIVTFSQSFKLARGDSPVLEDLMLLVSGNNTGKSLISLGLLCLSKIMGNGSPQ